MHVQQATFSNYIFITDLELRSWKYPWSRYRRFLSLTTVVVFWVYYRICLLNSVNVLLVLFNKISPFIVGLDKSVLKKYELGLIIFPFASHASYFQFSRHFSESDWTFSGKNLLSLWALRKVTLEWLACTFYVWFCVQRGKDSLPVLPLRNPIKVDTIGVPNTLWILKTKSLKLTLRYRINV